jgi:hypothetical protein
VKHLVAGTLWELVTHSRLVRVKGICFHAVIDKGKRIIEEAGYVFNARWDSQGQLDVSHVTPEVIDATVVLAITLFGGVGPKQIVSAGSRLDTPHLSQRAGAIGWEDHVIELTGIGPVNEEQDQACPVTACDPICRNQRLSISPFVKRTQRVATTDTGHMVACSTTTKSP